MDDKTILFSSNDGPEGLEIYTSDQALYITVDTQVASGIRVEPLKLGKIRKDLETALGSYNKAADYILELTDGQIGFGDDPVGFLVASHASIRQQRDEARTGLPNYIALLNQHLDGCPIDGGVCTSCHFVRRMLREAEALKEKGPGL